MKILKSTFVNNEPLSITDLYNSKSDEAAVVDYITGSAIRGAVMNRLADQGVLAGDVKKAMFDGSVCFGNAYPILVDSDYNKFETIPTPRGFYENRDQSGAIRHAFAQNRDSQMKRAKVGSFASLALENEHKLLYTTPLEGEIFKTRLARNNTDKSRDKEEAKQALFRGSYLEKNQTFCGRIFFSDACSDEICKLIETELNHPGLQLGGMRSAGHGGVTVIVEWDAPADTKHLDKILAQKKSEDGFFYMDMICLSNMCMVNQYGEPCGMNGIEIAEKLHLTECGFECVDYATSVTHYCSFNRIAGGRSPELPVFEGGSMFRFRTKKLPTKEDLAAVEANGLGLMVNEGFGRVQFSIGIEEFTEKCKCEPSVLTDGISDQLQKIDQYQIDVAQMKVTCAKSILRMKMEDGITEYIIHKGENLQKSRETNSQRGMITMLCKNYRYEPEIALEKFEEYIAHAEQKDAQTRVYRVRTRSRSALFNEVRDILMSPLFDLISLKSDTICGLKIRELITEEDEMRYKLDLISELMSYINRAGKE